tara:strand:- start:183 stop:704 length:522 start_codon:yes stop_codon:yes gene_type:complete
MKGEKLKGALSRGPKEKAMERLSPGIYRGSKGGLVGQGNQAIRRQPQQQMPQAVAGAASGMRQLGPLPTQASPEQVGQMIAGQPLEDRMQQYSPEESQRLLQSPFLQQIRAQMPQPSANMGGQYRLSPGVYGTREQAMQQMYQPIPGLQNGLGQQGNMPPIDWNQVIQYRNRG